jgi:hypothetical protein
MAMKSNRKLFERDIHDALVLSSRRIVKLAEKKLDELKKGDDEFGWWVWEKATVTEILEQYDRKNLRIQVHNFINKYPILMGCTDKEVVVAFIKETRERLVNEVITRVMFEEDVNGEPRFMYVGNEKFAKNPKFIEPEEDDDDEAESA